MPAYKLPPLGFYRPSEGNLGNFVRDYDEWTYEPKKGKTLSWYTCREEFHGEEEAPYKLFFFCTKRPNNVIAFIRRAEDILNLKQKERLKIVRTNEKDVLAIRTSLRRFWGNEHRQKLLTILLRAGTNFDPKTRSEKKFWEAALDGEYVSDTEYAIRRFMSGFTKFRTKKTRMSKYCGWVDTFQDDTFDAYYDLSNPDEKKAMEVDRREHRKHVNSILVRGCDAHRKRKKVPASRGRRR